MVTAPVKLSNALIFMTGHLKSSGFHGKFSNLLFFHNLAVDFSPCNDTNNVFFCIAFLQHLNIDVFSQFYIESGVITVEYRNSAGCDIRHSIRDVYRSAQKVPGEFIGEVTIHQVITFRVFQLANSLEGVGVHDPCAIALESLFNAHLKVNQFISSDGSCSSGSNALGAGCQTGHLAISANKQLFFKEFCYSFSNLIDYISSQVEFSVVNQGNRNLGECANKVAFQSDTAESAALRSQCSEFFCIGSSGAIGIIKFGEYKISFYVELGSQCVDWADIFYQFNDLFCNGLRNDCTVIGFGHVTGSAAFFQVATDVGGKSTFFVLFSLFYSRFFRFLRFIDGHCSPDFFNGCIQCTDFCSNLVKFFIFIIVHGAGFIFGLFNDFIQLIYQSITFFNEFFQIHDYPPYLIPIFKISICLFFRSKAP
nr:MAG TPA: hypothetical protein [Caudoviricetes sp.]